MNKERLRKIDRYKLYLRGIKKLTRPEELENNKLKVKTIEEQQKVLKRQIRVEEPIYFFRSIKKKKKQ